jgi:c-di-GMP-binding flagellar brake protein YcgR
MRKHDRAELKTETRILFGVCREKNSHEIPEKVSTKNISTGGLCVVSNVELKRGTVIAAEIFLNKEGTEKFKAYCEAVWSRKETDSGYYETGLRFIDLKNSDEGNLKEFVNKNLLN